MINKNQYKQFIRQVARDIDPKTIRKTSFIKSIHGITNHYIALGKSGQYNLTFENGKLIKVNVSYPYMPIRHLGHSYITNYVPIGPALDRRSPANRQVARKREIENWPKAKIAFNGDLYDDRGIFIVKYKNGTTEEISAVWNTGGYDGGVWIEDLTIHSKHEHIKRGIKAILKRLAHNKSW